MFNVLGHYGSEKNTKCLVLILITDMDCHDLHLPPLQSEQYEDSQEIEGEDHRAVIYIHKDNATPAPGPSYTNDSDDERIPCSQMRMTQPDVQPDVPHVENKANEDISIEMVSLKFIT